MSDETTSEQTLSTNDKIMGTLQVHSALLQRMAFMGHAQSHEGKRDYRTVLGYDACPTVEQFIARYHRGGIAKRLVDAYPDACWSALPRVTDDEGAQETTPFETAWDDLAKRLKLSHFFKRSDKVAGLGEYGVLFVGFNDGKDPKEPLEKGNHEVLFVRPYTQLNADITAYVSDHTNPDFGKPELYQLTTARNATTGGVGNVRTSAVQSSTMTVHYSRVIHIAEDLLEDDIYGIPCLRPVWDHLTDLLYKVVGGSSEIFFINARGGLAVSADAEAEIGEAAAKDVEEQLEKYLHGLRRFLFSQGTDTKPIEQAVASPADHVNVLLDLIAGTKGVPKRILIGSERGELASSQDENNWSNRVSERRESHCGPMIVSPFVQLMIDTGNLPEPADGFEVVFDDEDQIGPKERSEIASNYASAMDAFASAKMKGGEVVTDKQFAEDVCGFEYHEDEMSIKDEEDEEDEMLNVPEPDEVEVEAAPPTRLINGNT